MKLQKNVFKRTRPALGTFVEISLADGTDPQSKITSAFAVVSELEKIFNFHDRESELSRYNRHPGFKPGTHLNAVLEFADKVKATSNGAFSVDPGKADLSGIAKGYIVDEVIKHLSQSAPTSQILVNAGGDLRFFNWPKKKVTVRCALAGTELLITKDAMASSVFETPAQSAPSTTYFSKKTAHSRSTVSVLADSCMTADALTKVGLFADAEIVQKCAKTFNSEFLFFDENGELAQYCKSDEVQ